VATASKRRPHHRLGVLAAEDVAAVVQAVCAQLGI
jgi:hypothetical protein